jgi:Peptidase family S41
MAVITRNRKTRTAGTKANVTRRRPIAKAATAPKGLAAAFLSEVATEVRDHLLASQELKDFLPSAGTLTLAERRLLVDQALVLMEQNYAHLPLKVAMHAVNPVQKLRVLRARLERQTLATMGPEWTFHAEMSEIFHSVRDLHTNYLLPAPFNGKIAYLPFLIEEYQATDGPRYVVAHLVQGFSAPSFGPGAEITHWAGIPIRRAVDINANRFAGSNLPARLARGVESLTIRALRIHLPPDEEFVTVGYVGLDGTARELREKWLVVDNLPPIADADAVTPGAAAQGLDLGADEVARARRILFAPRSLAAEAVVRAEGRRRSSPGSATAVPAAAVQAGDVPTTMPGVFRARTVTTPSGTFGHLRIFTFSVNDPDAFVQEFARLIELLPQNGLIVDVRGNGGGHIFASEFALQTLTPRRVLPEPVQFINTPLNLNIVRKHKDNPVGIDLGPWFPSMEQATETGSVFSAAFPITPEDQANAIGQRYHGPVLLVTDARCYSATDIFAAGFQDHQIGPIIGVDDNTGAGGANVWTQALLKQLLEVPTPEATPYKTLPNQAGMRVSIRRTLRVGPQSGTPVEDLGIVPDVRHKLTKNDVLNGNVDLFARAGQVLSAMPARKLLVTATQSGPNLTVQLQVSNIDRADVYVDGRPRGSMNISGANASFAVTGVPGASAVRVEGYAAGLLVAARTVTV